MTTKNNLTLSPVRRSSLTKRMLYGAGIALILITLLLLSVEESDPGWPEFWMVKPLIVVPLAGAAGGLFSYLMDNVRYKGGWKTILAIGLSILVYIISLWLGTVIGLNGTLWN